jgi:hypothetical protein
MKIDRKRTLKSLGKKKREPEEELAAFSLFFSRRSERREASEVEGGAEKKTAPLSPLSLLSSFSLSGTGLSLSLALYTRADN